jgi:iron(III) transport system substrate-binding protein
VIFLLALLVLPLSGCSCQPRVVVYCAHDREFSESILHDFTAQTNLRIAPRFDNEANKAVGLYEDLIREASAPRCDVHWNNEILATIRLQRKGLLAPYQSPAAKPFPAVFKARDHTWTAFAARARVLLLNTEVMAKRGIPRVQWPRCLEDLTDKRWEGQVAMAKPFAGTTATQAACLFQAWGKEDAKKFYKALRANGVKLVAGNKQVAEGVGQGQFAVGLTDTDDAMLEVDAKHPVEIIFPDADAPRDSRRGVLFIPNTVAVIEGCPNPVGARQLVDYLLSPEVETKLAKSGSRQIPLNPNVKADLPPQMRTPAQVTVLPVDFERAADLWEETQAFLKEQFGS